MEAVDGVGDQRPRSSLDARSEFAEGVKSPRATRTGHAERLCERARRAQAGSRQPLLGSASNPLQSWYGAWRSLVSALVWGTRGRQFESARPDWLGGTVFPRRPLRASGGTGRAPADRRLRVDSGAAGCHDSPGPCLRPLRNDTTRSRPRVPAPAGAGRDRRPRPAGRERARDVHLLLPLVRDAQLGRGLLALGPERPHAASRSRLELLPGARAVLEPGPPGRRRADARGRQLVVGLGLIRRPAPADDRAYGHQTGHARGGSDRALRRPHRGKRGHGPRPPARARDQPRLRVPPVRDRRGKLGRGSADGAGRPGARPDGQRRTGSGCTLRRHLHLRRRQLRAGHARTALHASAQGGTRLRSVRRARVRSAPSDGRYARPTARRRSDVRRHVARGYPRGRRPRHDHELQRVARRHTDRAGDDAAAAKAHRRRQTRHLACQGAL